MARLAWIILLVAAVRVESLGTPTTIEEFPSIAQVELRVLGSWVQQCAGAIITNYHILSNAYCFSGRYYDPETRRFRVGATNRNQGDIMYVQTAYVHPYYGSLGNDGDISVVRLTSPLILGPTVQTISILGQGIVLPNGLQVTNVGWGATSQGGTTPNNQLHKINLYTHDYERCMEYYQILDEPEIITENMICVGRSIFQGRDFDARDIGAPLIYQNILVGLLSFGKTASGDSHPVVATNIAQFSEWIVETARY